PSRGGQGGDRCRYSAQGEPRPGGRRTGGGEGGRRKIENHGGDAAAQEGLSLRKPRAVRPSAFQLIPHFLSRLAPVRNSHPPRLASEAILFLSRPNLVALIRGVPLLRWPGSLKTPLNSRRRSLHLEPHCLPTEVREIRAPAAGRLRGT